MTRSQVGLFALGCVNIVVGSAFIGVGVYIHDLGSVAVASGVILGFGICFIAEARDPVLFWDPRAGVTVYRDIDDAEKARCSAAAKQTEAYFKSLRPNRATKATD